MAKSYGQSYLFAKFGDYEKEMMNIIMRAERIDTKSTNFEDIRYDIKRRQITNSLMYVLDSPNVVLLSGQKSLSKAFKVFAAKDVKTDRKLKVFIDCTNILPADKDGRYHCSNIDVLISYLTDAMITLIYYADEKRLTMNYDLTNSGAKCFSLLFTNIIDYLFKISISPSTKSQVLYLSSNYYIYNIVGREPNSSINNIAKRFSDITDREAEIIDFKASQEDIYKSLPNFVKGIGEIFKFDKLTLDIVVEKWMYLYGTGTVFGLEILPDFASMLIDTYVGTYINNQKTIEKIAGRDMVEFVKTALKIGESVR